MTSLLADLLAYMVKRQLIDDQLPPSFSLPDTMFLGRNVLGDPGGKEVRHVDHGPDNICMTVSVRQGFRSVSRLR